MLQLTKSNETTYTLVSDDENGENAALGEAVLRCAPHLSDAFDATEMDADGLLRFSFDKEDWPSLQEVIESDELAEYADPNALEAMGDELRTALDV